MASPDFIRVARVYKDLFCRYQTMQGRYVARRAVGHPRTARRGPGGEATGHLGKKAIVEQVGVEEFTRCAANRSSPFVGEFERLTERIGYWTDMEHAYYTFHPATSNRCGGNLQQLFEHGLLYEDLKVIPTARAAVRPSPATS